MSFDKYMGKEKRKPYRGAKALDATCRNHGSCPYCLSNRQYNTMKRLDASEEILKNYLTNENDMI